MLPRSKSPDKIAGLSPDVAKTPSPAGPVPLPYPNLTAPAKAGAPTSKVMSTPAPSKCQLSNAAVGLQKNAGLTKQGASQAAAGKPLSYLIDKTSYAKYPGAGKVGI